ncbi:MAG: hypothetical protein N4J56_002679 [Chroococcidiopsis sp. SAG 2025]|uniref:hypothetical protein n=1 Tax=Chroococcidiopsis sp. SAG 2025 TaxID=171389 RepID=UPI0029372F25|nr:hypothetical protein [Chroococcidiopsis sp. SAG 2025]MDV2993025.1 hypothetical protein [Chroococcidiopsis sp. SAG 2025]
MKTAILPILAIALVVFSNRETPAQQVETSSDRSFLALVEGDDGDRCSFISADVLERSADIAQGLLFVRSGDSPDQVKYKMRFVPDGAYANDILQWTAIAGKNYTRADVNFDKNRAATRSFTMAVNYQQPEQKQCRWEVREPQPAAAQTMEQDLAPAPDSNSTEQDLTPTPDRNP